VAINPTPTRLHPNLIAGVMEALETSFGKGFYVDKVLERIFKANPKWGARDRAFVAENTYDMVRWWRLLWSLAGKEPSLRRKDLYDLFGVWWLYKGETLPDWDKFDRIRDFDLSQSLKNLPEDVAIRQSFPDWLDQLASRELGDAWPIAAQQLNLEAPVVLRANRLKASREEVMQQLLSEGIATHPLEEAPDALVLNQRANTFRTQAFSAGMFEVQDGGSQQIAPFAQPEPGMRVIDACAGAGGKSLHLAALMNNKGSILSMDVEGWKLEELKKRARRNGVHNLETRVIDSTKVIKRLEHTADRVLLDVPCSGTGVIRRNPDTKWKLTEDYLTNVRATQAEILERYSTMLKPGGKLVYATCSILPSENEQRVEAFLLNHPEYSLEEEVRVQPGTHNDGFYMARLFLKP
jgi:16S rRNA (cytosine967-C5)-methyltransferase